MKTAKRKQLKLDGDFEVYKKEETNSTSNNKESSQANSYTILSLGTQLGFAVAIPIVGGVLLGDYLDKKFNTSPRLTLSLLFFGVCLGMFNLVYLVLESTKNKK